MSVINVSIDTDGLSMTASVDGNPVSLSSLFVDDYSYKGIDDESHRVFSLEMTEKPKVVNGVETQTRLSFRKDSESPLASSKELVSRNESVSRPVLSWENNAERLNQRTEELNQEIAKIFKIGKYT